MSNGGFWGEGKPEYPEKTSLCIEENQQTQPTYDAKSNLGHIGGKRVLSPLHHPCTSIFRKTLKKADEFPQLIISI